MQGREYEIGRLIESLNSDVSELIAVYGRRRIGNDLKMDILFLP